MNLKLLLTFLVLQLPLGILARDFSYTYEGQTLTYTVIDETAKTCRTKEGTLTTPGCWVSGNLIIPSKVSDGTKEYTVTEIGTYSFYGRALTDVTIPNSVTSIAKGAFYKCSSITTFNIPNSVTSIGYDAFHSCTELTSVNIPNSVTSIGMSAFRGCKNLTSVNIPNSVTSIEHFTFYGCSGLSSISIPSSVTSIGDHAFYFCTGLNSVNLPNSVTSIGEYAFNYCKSLTSISFPNSVTSIGKYAFQYCSGMTSVSFSNSITSIGTYAFNNCSGLTSVILPPSVKSIGGNAFYECEGLKKSAYPNSLKNPFYNGVAVAYSQEDSFIDNGAIYDNSGARLVFVSYDLKEFEIPSTVSIIGKEAFSYCSNLTSIGIPNSITSIGERAFYNCTGITSVTIPNSVKSIENYTFQGCSGLTSITIPNTITTIGKGAFQSCFGLTSVIIPNTVTFIGAEAFQGCNSLTSVNLPSSLSYFGADVFKGCSLKEVRIPKTIYCSDLNPTFFTFSSTDINVTSISFRLWQSSIVKIIDDSGKEISLKEATEIDNRYKYSWNGNTVKFTGLRPTQKVSFRFLGYNVSGTTNNVSISMSQVEKFADIAVVEASFGYEKFVEEYYFYMNAGGTKFKQKRISIPYEEGHGKKLTFCIKGDGFTNSKDLSLSYATPAFSDEDAVATSYTKARLTAKCNLSTGAIAGIEWRRHDAPDNVKSKTELCPVVNGVLMGELRGLKDDVYYKFRPFYELGSTIYYGEWTGFYTGDAGVYFEPEVGTLPATVTSNSVLFEGYVFAGTDDISESGIEYRRVGAAPKSAQASLKADGEWIKVPASSTTFFKVDLDNLAYESEYEYRSYAVADNKTYYGATASFITEADQSGVESIFATEAEGRTLSLLHNPVQGYPQLIVSGNGELVDCFIHSTTGMLMKSCSVIADGTPQEIEVNLLPGMYIVSVTNNASRSSIRMLAR